MDIQLLCTSAQVSTSGYYKWLKDKDRPEKDHEDYLKVKAVFDKGKGKYGWRSIKMRIPNMNHKKISRIMNKYNLITKIRRKNPYKKIMKKSQEHRTFPNVLDRQFSQTSPYTVFCTDITYLRYNHRFAYFSAIKDIATGEIVGYDISPHLHMEIVMNTLESLKNTTPNLHGVLIHSDQGFHYTNPQYIEEVKRLNMIQSMSGKGVCIDNAPIESFFGHMKDDIDVRQCKTFEEVRLQAVEYVRYYNNERRQWDKQKMTPVEYRNHLLLARK